MTLSKEEQAIRLLQKAGYVIFKKEARLVLSYQDLMDSERVAAYNDDPRWREAWEQNVAQKLVQELWASKHIKFLHQPPVKDKSGSIKHWEHRNMTGLLATLNFFPNARREWER